ncbi:MAG: hypothetical protein Q8S84_01215 [bacterium]|nr:hypothetical protein [bacterium]MDP3380193.1 hypothetical protein [bacterium]
MSFIGQKSIFIFSSINILSASILVFHIKNANAYLVSNSIFTDIVILWLGGFGESVIFKYQYVVSHNRA